MFYFLVTVLYWSTRSTLRGISFWSTSLYVISQPSYLLYDHLERNEESNALLWILYKPKLPCPNPLTFFVQGSWLANGMIALTLLLTSSKMSKWFFRKLTHEERMDWRSEAGDAKKNAVRILVSLKSPLL